MNNMKKISLLRLKFWMWVNAYSGKQLFGNVEGKVVPNWKAPEGVSHDERKVIVNSTLEAAGKMLLFTFNMFSLGNRMDAMIKEETSGDEFILLFRKVTPKNMEEVTRIVFMKD